MTETELDRAIEELDRLINDPDVRMDPERIWTLLAEVSSRAAPLVVSPRSVVGTGLTG